MMQKSCLSCILFIWMLGISLAQKKIVFTKVQCVAKSNKISKVECFLEDKSAFTIQVETSTTEIKTLVGMSNLRLYVYGRSNVVRVNGLGLDICRLMAVGKRPSVLTLLYKGIQQTENNLPKKCPLKRNYNYTLKHMKFDANLLPVYLPEYNFTFNALFNANNVYSFEVRVEGSYCEFNNDCTGAGTEKSTAT